MLSQGHVLMSSAGNRLHVPMGLVRSPQGCCGFRGADVIPTGLAPCSTVPTARARPALCYWCYVRLELDWDGGLALCHHSSTGSHPLVLSVFQLCHQTYKPFVFAAETLADLSM